MSSQEMAKFAKAWRRGIHLFKQAYEQGPVDPETNVHTYMPKETVAPEVLDLVDKCNVEKMIAYIQENATPKMERGMYFAAVFCLGEEALKKEEEKREQKTMP